MKKITTLFKTMLLAVVVLVMAQGCIPTTPVGGNPTITGTFEVNISDGSILQQTILDSSQHRITKKIFVDNDSIEFTFVIESNGYNTNNERLYSESFLIETDYNAIYNYGFLVGLSNGGSILVYQLHQSFAAKRITLAQYRYQHCRHYHRYQQCHPYQSARHGRF